MAHSTHKLKAWTGDVHKPLVFCTECGVEDSENAINNPCSQSFYVSKLDSYVDKVQTEFVSGLSQN